MPELEKTEKITINLGLVDLGQIDLLVQEGFYSNRTDFIRTAIRTQLAPHAEVVKRRVARKTMVLGVQHYTRRDLEAVRAAGEKLQINVLGLASIAVDVSPASADTPAWSMPPKKRASRGFATGYPAAGLGILSPEALRVPDHIHSAPRRRGLVEPEGVSSSVRVGGQFIEGAYTNTAG